VSGKSILTLRDLLITVQTRDVSGPRALNRFDYQKDWTLCLLMQLHDTHGDYMLILDYHDDVVLLDSSTAPSRATFFQVKTNPGGNWTLKQLTRQKKGKKGPLPSHLGKLWSHQVSFGSITCSCFFVTNGLWASFRRLVKDPIAQPRRILTTFDIRPANRDPSSSMRPLCGTAARTSRALRTFRSAGTGRASSCASAARRSRTIKSHLLLDLVEAAVAPFREIALGLLELLAPLRVAHQ
jgi:hypothetical protein